MTRFEAWRDGRRVELEATSEAFAIAELEDRFPRRSFVVFRRDTSADRWRHAFSIDSEGRIRRPTPADASSGRTRREAAG